jgi:AcrR family transcriptional regulator
MTRSQSGPTKGDRTRTRILEVLEAMLTEAPHEAVTIAEVTRRAAITRPAFYFHFDTLGAAVSSLVERLFEDFAALAGDWYAHAGRSQPESLRTGMTDTVALWRRHAVVMDAVMRAAASDDAASRILDEWIDAFTARAIPVIRADARGLEVPPDAVARMLVSMTFDAMRREVRRIVATGTPDDELADTLVAVWSRTIYPDTAL